MNDKQMVRCLRSSMRAQLNMLLLPMQAVTNRDMWTEVQRPFAQANDTRTQNEEIDDECDDDDDLFA